MYHFRLKIFIMLCIGGLVVAVGRLLTLQTFNAEQARQEIADMRVLPPQQRPTVRGKIVDRYDKPLALDKPAFYLHISYQLTRYIDPRWREGKILRAITEDKSRAEVEREFYEDKWKKSLEDLDRAIDLAWQVADTSREEIEETIKRTNDQIWELSRYILWKRKGENQGKNRSQYLDERESIPVRDIVAVSLAEMKQTYPLVELKTRQDILRAQIELLNLDQLSIKSEAKRNYPYNASVCRLIGWVAPWQDSEAEIFKDNKYMSYKPGEVVGKFGLEKVYEPVLRGSRGEVRYDIEGNVVEQKEPQYGRDVRLTIDIDLQKKVETALADNTMPHGNKFCAAVVLDVASNDILAMASMPIFDLNTIRQTTHYNRIFNPKDPNKLWEHKALERNYPPGSTVKPLILIAGLEENKIGPYESITCSSWKMPAKGWPRCLLQKSYGIGHDDQFGTDGNFARNAIRGSCNIYFTRLANRLEGEQLQKWLFDFGYGQPILKTPLPPEYVIDKSLQHSLQQSYGCLVYDLTQPKVSSASELKQPPDWEKKWWGMGQGSLRATVLQAANSLSTIARDGVYKSPRLIHDENDPYNETTIRKLPISKKTLSTVREGMKAVVYEQYGTAYKEFNKPGEKSVLFDRDMTIYGKTGSTEKPYHAWFECFAEDRSGRGIVIVILVEKGQRGAGEAAPLGHRILRYCNEAGYIGAQPIELPPAADQDQP